MHAYSGSTAAPSIMIVEDEDLLRELLTEAFSEMGVAVSAVATADDGLTAFEKNTAFDLLVTDVRTPGRMNGWDLAKAVYDQRPNVPIIITSGYSAEQHNNELPPSACFVQKPWSLESLCELAKTLLHGS
ncbi:response regulator [Pseudomonas japonica]|uniref:response regulator n=1 Tax=Pseudomonas japonica TaxID=256466 RepID=UPI0015E3D51D|nr:response regulator [Pseudomonas japonica]MBA1245465.1 response regulator [Pseudomonas japonica]